LVISAGTAAAQSYDAGPVPVIAAPPDDAAMPAVAGAERVGTPGPATESGLRGMIKPPAAASEPLKIGDLTLHPSISTGFLYDDNVFATRHGTKGDGAVIVRPELRIAAPFLRGTIAADAYVEGEKYFHYSSEDALNGGLTVAGKVPLDADTRLKFGLQYLHGTVPRGSSESVLNRTDEPISYDRGSASLGIDRRFGRWWTSVGLAGTAIEYQNPTVGGVELRQSYADGTVSSATGRIGYVVAPRTSLFVELVGNDRNFHLDSFDSDGFRAVGGVLFEPGPGARVKGEAYAGYMRQLYQGASFRDVETWTAGGALGFIVNRRLTLTIGGSRVAEESAVGGGVSVVESQAAVRADYRLLPNLIVGAGMTYLRDGFRGLGATDDYWSPLASIQYLISKNLTAAFDYRRVDFNPDGLVGTTPFRRNVFMLSLNAHY
jgi:hypothetical protein